VDTSYFGDHGSEYSLLRGVLIVFGNERGVNMDAMGSSALGKDW